MKNELESVKKKEKTDIYDSKQRSKYSAARKMIKPKVKFLNLIYILKCATELLFTGIV